MFDFQGENLYCVVKQRGETRKKEEYSMKNSCKKLASLGLALVLLLSLAVPAMAYTTPDFADLPADNWAYEPVMRMADQGVIQGTGNGMFSPEMKVSVAQFLTLVGRIVFPDTVVGANDTWYGPYVAAAQAGGFLTGTQVDVNQPEAEISRYDMAVILRAAAKKLGKVETLAQQSQVTDFGMIPNMYTEAVLAVYGMGLIKGDQAGNFNGGNTMMRNETATVIDRLVALKAGSGSQSSGTTVTPGTDPEKPVEPEKPNQPEGPLEPEIVGMPTGEEMATYTFEIRFQKTDHVLGAPARDTKYDLPNVPVKVYYTPDGGKTATLVAEGVTGEASAVHGGVDWLVLKCEAPESWGLSKSSEAGFYYSAETVYEGQRLVTSDLRTDGRAFANIDRCSPDSFLSRNIELTPPEGLKIHFTFAGTAETESEAIPVPGTVIQLQLEDGTVVGKTVAGTGGKFEMDCAVDILDGVLNTNQEMYQIVAHGELDGVLLSQRMTYFVSEEPILYSLERLGGNPRSINFPKGSYHVRLS